MQILVSEISKYIIIIITAIYAYLGFIGFINNDKKRDGEIYFFQPVLILMFHFTGFLCIFLKASEIKILILYFAQVLLFAASTFLYRIFYKKLFKSLFFHMQFLIAVGFVFVTRLKYMWGVKQTIFVAMALAACLVLPFLIKKMVMLRSIAYLYAAAGIGALAYVYLMAKVQYGAKNWIQIFGISIQPSEFVKILLIFMIASLFYVSRNLKQIIITTGLTAVMVLLLVLSKDLGGAMLYFTTFVVMTYFAIGNIKLLGLFTGGGVLSAIAGYYLFSHVRVRVQAFVDPWKYIDDKGYQVTQSLFGIGSGGWFGFGLGGGSPKNTPGTFVWILSDFNLSLYNYSIYLTCMAYQKSISSACFHRLCNYVFFSDIFIHRRYCKIYTIYGSYSASYKSRRKLYYKHYSYIWCDSGTLYSRK